MSLKEKIQEDLKVAVKNRNQIVSLVLRSLIAEINSRAIELKKKEEGLSDEEVEQVVLKEIKKRQDAIEQYTKGNRDDLVKNEQEEMGILNIYAPQMMGETELHRVIDDTINKIGAKDIQDAGRVIGEVIKQTGNKADGSLVSKLVRDKLQ